MEERTRELSTLVDISRTVALHSGARAAAGPDPRPAQGRDGVHRLGHVMTVEGYRNASVIVGYRGPIPAARGIGMRFPIAEAQAVWDVLNRCEPVIIPDVYADEPLANAYRASLGDRLHTAFAYLRAWMAVPLTHKGRIIGLLSRGSAASPATTRSARAPGDGASPARPPSRSRTRGSPSRRRTLAALEERQRLARELHDSVSQALYGIALGARTARTLLDRDPAQAAEPLDYVLSLAEAGLAEMRALIFELRPESLESEGLVAALEQAGGRAARAPRHRRAGGPLRRAGRAAGGERGALPHRPGGAAQHRQARPRQRWICARGGRRPMSVWRCATTAAGLRPEPASSPATWACAPCASASRGPAAEPPSQRTRPGHHHPRLAPRGRGMTLLKRELRPS